MEKFHAECLMVHQDLKALKVSIESSEIVEKGRSSGFGQVQKVDITKQSSHRFELHVSHGQDVVAEDGASFDSHGGAGVP